MSPDRRPRMELTACPECGLPAEILDRTPLGSTHGPVEVGHVLCVRRHRFVMPLVDLPRATAVDAVRLPPRRRSDSRGR